MIRQVQYGVHGYFGLPEQKLTIKEKIKKYKSVDEWAAYTTDAIEQLLGFSWSTRINSMFDRISMEANLDLIEKGVYDTSKFKELTEPYGTNETVQFPVKLEHYDIISSKLNVLIGEELLKPFNYIVVNKSSEAAEKFNKAKNDIVQQYLMQQLMIMEQQMAKLNGQESMFKQEAVNNQEQAQVKTPDGKILKSMNEIQQYAESTFSEVSEMTANDILRYLEKNLDLQYKFIKGYRRYLATDTEIYCVSEIGGDVDVRVINPILFDCDLAPENDFIEDSMYCREIRFLTVGEVLDEFHDVFTEEEVETLEMYTQGRADKYDDYTQNVFKQGANTGVRVARFEWKSMKKIGVVTIFATDEQGNELPPEEIVVPEDYKAQTPDEQIKWMWITERWESYKIMDNIYVKMRPLEKQYRALDSFADTKGSYIGYKGHYSLVDQMIKYQDLYNQVMFQLKLAFARAKGKGLIIDVHQIPKRYGWDIDKWLYYLDVFGVAFINSSEKNEEGERSSFNQFTDFDLTLGNQIQSYIAQLEFIKAEVENVSGISRQRQGEIKNTETVGGVERSVAQSSAITEKYSYIHSVVKKNVLQRCIDIAKTVYKKGKKGMAIMSDYSRSMFEISDDDFQYADLGVFVSNSAKDKSELEQIRQVIGQAYQAQVISFHDMIKAIRTDSIAKLEQIAELSTQKMDEQKQQEMMSQQQMQQQQLQSQQQMQEQMLQMEAQKLELEKYKADLQAQTAIRVAELKAEGQIYAMRMDIDADANNNGVLDVIEEKKVMLEEKKINLDEKKHNDEMKMKEKEIEVKKIAAQKKPSSTQK